MIIECNDVLISTNEDVKEHKIRIQATDIKEHCESYRPETWFANINDEGVETFWQLHYNESGSELKKITAWDVNPDFDSNGCYFENRGKTISMNSRTVWKRHWWN